MLRAPLSHVMTAALPKERPRTLSLASSSSIAVSSSESCCSLVAIAALSSALVFPHVMGHAMNSTARTVFISEVKCASR